jgi:hypothetical protein
VRDVQDDAKTRTEPNFYLYSHPENGFRPAVGGGNGGKGFFPPPPGVMSKTDLINSSTAGSTCLGFRPGSTPRSASVYVGLGGGSVVDGDTFGFDFGFGDDFGFGVGLGVGLGIGLGIGFRGGLVCSCFQTSGRGGRTTTRFVRTWDSTLGAVGFFADACRSSLRAAASRWELGVGLGRPTVGDLTTKSGIETRTVSGAAD